MDQHPGKSHPSGKTAKSKVAKKRKKGSAKANGKSNGKTDWKEMCQELSAKVGELEETIATADERHSQVYENFQSVTEDLDNAKIALRTLKAELAAHQKAQTPERDKVVLRNLRYFHGQMLNAQLKCKEDKEIISKACAEVSGFIREQT